MRNKNTVGTNRNVGAKRTLELVLLAVALSVGVFGYIIVALNRTGQLPPNLYMHIGFLVTVSLVLHLLIRKFAPYADPLILPIGVALNGIGLVMIYRLDFSYKALGLTQYVVDNKQLIWSFIGVLACVCVFIIMKDHRNFKNFTYIAGFLAIVLLLLPMIPGLGKNIYGAKVWIHIGPLSFQPGEIAKLCLALFFAGYFVQTREKLAFGGKKILGIRLPRIRDCGPLIFAWGISIGVLVMQRDLGTSLLIFGLFVAMLYVATDRVSWIIIGFIMFIPGALVAAKVFPHVGARFTVWWNAFDNTIYNQDPGGSGQLVAGLFGFANGGLTGTGLGKGYPQLVPFANSDFIIASIAEELGLTGFMAVICLYILFTQRGFKAAQSLRDDFGKLFATGLSFIVVLQVFVIVGGVTRLIPLTGLTTPFLAYGGSSLVSNWIILGLLIRLTDSARRNSLFDKEIVLMEYEPVKEVITVQGSRDVASRPNRFASVLSDRVGGSDTSGVNVDKASGGDSDISDVDTNYPPRKDVMDGGTESMGV